LHQPHSEAGAGRKGQRVRPGGEVSRPGVF
jgi:hypothetical protein